MNIEETLDYLYELKRIVVPVTVAQNSVADAEYNLIKARSFLSKTILVFGGLAIFWLIVINDHNYEGYNHFFFFDENGVIQGGKIGNFLLFAGIAVALFYYKQKRRVDPAQAVYNNARQILNRELNNPDYINGVVGFPQNFYNYSDIYRLIKLIEEGRADSLKEAFNLLEQQQYQETQIAIQEEMRQLQADMAESARATAINTGITAAASVATAANTRDIAANTSNIANNTSAMRRSLENIDRNTF